MLATCKTCGFIGEQSKHFYRSSVRRKFDGEFYYQKVCKKCVRSKFKERYHRRMDFLHELKKKEVCSVCGEARWWVLDYHHEHDKKFRLACSSQHTKEEILAEIKKCIVLCANCHRDLHCRPSEAS